MSGLSDFKIFRVGLEDIPFKKEFKSLTGRSRFNVILIFKVIFLQCYFGLGDRHSIPDNRTCQSPTVP